MKNNEIEKFVKLLKENDFTDSYDSYLIVNDNDVIYKDQGGWFELKLVNKKDVDQTALANKSITLSFKVTAFSCTATA